MSWFDSLISDEVGGYVRGTCSSYLINFTISKITRFGLTLGNIRLRLALFALSDSLAISYVQRSCAGII